MANTYLLNGQNLEQFGVIPGRAPDSNLAISGALDMPSRLGKTHHEWPDENGIEPYLRADEIFFGGRDISFHFFIKAIDRESAVKKCYGLFDLINSFTGIVLFASTLFGSYQVIVKDEVKIEYMGSGFCQGVLTMRQPIVDVAGSIPTANNQHPSIDKISLKKLGFEVVSMTEQYNRPGAKSTEVTAYGYESAKVNKIGYRTINLELVTQQFTYGYGLKH